MQGNFRGNSLRVKRKCTAGVSLVDLVITILIMGILAAAALPKFADALAKMRAEAVARRVVSDLNYARRNAIQTSKAATITFTTSPPRYTMTGVKNPNFPQQDYVVNLVDVDSAVSLQAVSFNSGMVLSYNTYGRPLVGANALTAGSLVVRSGSFLFTVTVDPATGEAAIP